MEITKDKIKRSAIGSGVFLAASEYLSAGVLKEFPKFQNYEFEAFKESISYNLSNPITNMTTAFSNDLFIQSQPILFTASLLLGAKILLDKPKSYEMAAEYGAYGTSRWANNSEIFGSEDTTTNMKNEGPLLARHKRKPIILSTDSYMNRNICIVGGSGAGKTRASIIPNILKTKEKTVIVIDVKGELYERTSEIKRQQGYDVRLVNFKDRKISDRYNLFDYIREDADAYKIAKTMVENTAEGGHKKTDFFELAQTSVLQSIILFVKYALPKEQQHMGSVFNVAQLPLGELQDECYKFPADHIVRRSFKAAVERLGDPKTASNVLITLMQTLNPWQYDDVCEFTAANDFLFEDLGKEKMAVYVMIPVADNEFKPLITTFFTQMFSELYRLADHHYGELPRNVFLALDEFANIGKLPNFEKRLSTTRSLGIEVSVVLQSISQLQRVYGKEIAKEVVDNCDTRLLLKANEPETAKYFSQMAGKTTIKVRNNSSSSGSKSSSKSESNNYVSRDLITADEVQRLSKNEQLLFLTGKYPMKIKKAWFDDFKYFTKMIGKRVSRSDYPVPDRGEYSAFYPIEAELPDLEGLLQAAGKAAEEQSKKLSNEEEDENVFDEKLHTEDTSRLDQDEYEEKNSIHEFYEQLEEKKEEKEVNKIPENIDPETGEIVESKPKEENTSKDADNESLDDLIDNFKF